MKIWNSADYDKVNGSHMRDAMEALEKILEYMDAGHKFDKILDIGCGTGNVTRALSDEVPHKQIYAIDFEGMISYAMENHADPSITYLVQDIAVPWEDIRPELKALEGQFSLVWANRVLHWVPVSRRSLAARNIARFLRPGGLFIATCTHARFVNEYLHTLSPELQALGNKYLKMQSTREQGESWAKYFKSAGLLDVHVEFKRKEWQFENPEGYWKLVTQWKGYMGPYIPDSAGPEQKQTVIDSFADIYYRMLQVDIDQEPELGLRQDETYLRYGIYEVTGIK